MSQNAIERVGVKHPECCKGTLGGGNCTYKRVPSSDFCPLHGGSAAIKQNQKTELKNYVLAGEYGRRAAQMSNSPGLKDLTDEIALVRVMMEGVFKNITSDQDIVLYVDKVDKLATTIGKLIKQTQELQEKNKELLDRKTVLAIGDDIIGVLLGYITDPDMLGTLATGISDVIARRLSLAD